MSEWPRSSLPWARKSLTPSLLQRYTGGPLFRGGDRALIWLRIPYAPQVERNPTPRARYSDRTPAGSARQGPYHRVPRAPPQRRIPPPAYSRHHAVGPEPTPGTHRESHQASPFFSFRSVLPAPPRWPPA